MSTFISNPEETKEYAPRFKIFYIGIGITFFIFIMRLWYLQIIEGNKLREFSDKNRIKQTKIFAPRGLILDHEGRPLVQNLPSFDAIAFPQYLGDIPTFSKAVAPLLSMTNQQLEDKIKRSKRINGSFAQIKIKENISKDEVFRLKRIRLDTPGLDVRESVLRYYPLGPNGAQLFGYVGEISKKQIPRYNSLYEGKMRFEQGDVIGKFGLEEMLEKEIHGQDGFQVIQVDAYGRQVQASAAEIYADRIRDIDPVPGYNAVLTIDKSLQEVASQHFTDQGKIGAVIAMRSNGAILALVNSPSFDPNLFSLGITNQMWSAIVNDPFHPMRNKAIQDHYSPGSTFKALIAVAALEEKEIKPNTVIFCPGSIRFGRRDYHDHLKGGHGSITLYEALERSSNVFFYKMGISLGIEKMYNYIYPMGIGQKTQIEVPRETSGLMPNEEWKKSNLNEEWQPGENLSVAIGQGFTQATPIQMAIAYNTIGTRGKVVKPYILDRIIDNDGKVILQNSPTVVRELTLPQATGVKVSESTFKTVTDALRRVVQGPRGTARLVHIPGADIAGKTGTSQVMGFSASNIYNKCENLPLTQRHHGWFIAFAPADNPEITVAALAEHSCHGSTGAGPVVREVIRAYFEKYHPERISEYLKKTKNMNVLLPAVQEVIEGE